MRRKLFALVDCNNFYVSCERVFNAALKNTPTIVLSNNDRCVVARSNEAKKLGVKMGQPVFEIAGLIKKHNIHVFSSNYSLYADMSKRVMQVLASFSPHVEIYSIDEAFLELTNHSIDDATEFGREIKDRVFQYVGIPVKENKVALLSRHSGQCCSPSLMARSVGKSVSCLTRTRLHVVFRIIKSLSCLETHPQGASMLD